MKTFSELYKDYYSEKRNYTHVSIIAPTIAEALAQGVTYIEMNKEDYTAFCMNYDQVLPSDWDRETFRGVKIHVV